MASNRQLAANRRNAQKSTGPRTNEGKEKASLNAMKHGLRSSQILLQNEDGNDYSDFYDGMIKSLAPEGQLEALLVERIVASAWRLRRIYKIESGLFMSMIQEDMNYHQEDNVGRKSTKADMRLALPWPRVGMELRRFDSLHRYESPIEKAFYKALHELERMQARRRGEAVPAPLSVDVAISGPAAPALDVTDE